MTYPQVVEIAKTKGCKWIAMDQDGRWFGYKTKPVLIEEDYYNPGEWDGICILLKPDTSEWKNTLTKITE